MQSTKLVKIFCVLGAGGDEKSADKCTGSFATNCRTKRIRSQIFLLNLSPIYKFFRLRFLLPLFDIHEKINLNSYIKLFQSQTSFY